MNQQDGKFLDMLSGVVLARFHKAQERKTSMRLLRENTRVSCEDQSAHTSPSSDPSTSCPPSLDGTQFSAKPSVSSSVSPPASGCSASPIAAVFSPFAIYSIASACCTLRYRNDELLSVLALGAVEAPLSAFNGFDLVGLLASFASLQFLPVQGGFLKNAQVLLSGEMAKWERLLLERFVAGVPHNVVPPFSLSDCLAPSASANSSRPSYERIPFQESKSERGRDKLHGRPMKDSEQAVEASTQRDTVFGVSEGPGTLARKQALPQSASLPFQRDEDSCEVPRRILSAGDQSGLVFDLETSLARSVLDGDLSHRHTLNAASLLHSFARFAEIQDQLLHTRKLRKNLRHPSEPVTGDEASRACRAPQPSRENGRYCGGVHDAGLEVILASCLCEGSQSAEKNDTLMARKHFFDSCLSLIRTHLYIHLKMTVPGLKHPEVQFLLRRTRGRLREEFKDHDNGVGFKAEEPAVQSDGAAAVLPRYAFSFSLTSLRDLSVVAHVLNFLPSSRSYTFSPSSLASPTSEFPEFETSSNQTPSTSSHGPVQSRTCASSTCYSASSFRGDTSAPSVPHAVLEAIATLSPRLVTSKWSFPVRGGSTCSQGHRMGESADLKGALALLASCSRSNPAEVQSETLDRRRAGLLAIPKSSAMSSGAPADFSQCSAPTKSSSPLLQPANPQAGHAMTGVSKTDKACVMTPPGVGSSDGTAYTFTGSNDCRSLEEWAAIPYSGGAPGPSLPAPASSPTPATSFLSLLAIARAHSRLQPPLPPPEPLLSQLLLEMQRHPSALSTTRLVSLWGVFATLSPKCCTAAEVTEPLRSGTGRAASEVRSATGVSFSTDNKPVGTLGRESMPAERRNALAQTAFALLVKESARLVPLFTASQLASLSSALLAFENVFITSNETPTGWPLPDASALEYRQAAVTLTRMVQRRLLDLWESHEGSLGTETDNNEAHRERGRPQPLETEGFPTNEREGRSSEWATARRSGAPPSVLAREDGLVLAKEIPENPLPTPPEAGVRYTRQIEVLGLADLLGQRQGTAKKGLERPRQAVWLLTLLGRFAPNYGQRAALPLLSAFVSESRNNCSTTRLWLTARAHGTLKDAEEARFHGLTARRGIPEGGRGSPGREATSLEPRSREQHNTGEAVSPPWCCPPRHSGQEESRENGDELSVHKPNGTETDRAASPRLVRSEAVDHSMNVTLAPFPGVNSKRMAQRGDFQLRQESSEESGAPRCFEERPDTWVSVLTAQEVAAVLTSMARLRVRHERILEKLCSRLVTLLTRKASRGVEGDDDFRSAGMSDGRNSSEDTEVLRRRERVGVGLSRQEGPGNVLKSRTVEANASRECRISSSSLAGVLLSLAKLGYHPVFSSSSFPLESAHDAHVPSPEGETGYTDGLMTTGTAEARQRRGNTGQRNTCRPRSAEKLGLVSPSAEVAWSVILEELVWRCRDQRTQGPEKEKLAKLETEERAALSSSPTEGQFHKAQQSPVSLFSAVNALYALALVGFAGPRGGGPSAIIRGQTRAVVPSSSEENADRFRQEQSAVEIVSLHTCGRQEPSGELRGSELCSGNLVSRAVEALVGTASKHMLPSGVFAASAADSKEGGSRQESNTDGHRAGRGAERAGEGAVEFEEEGNRLERPCKGREQLEALSQLVAVHAFLRPSSSVADAKSPAAQQVEGDGRAGCVRSLFITQETDVLLGRLKQIAENALEEVGEQKRPETLATTGNTQFRSERDTSKHAVRRRWGAACVMRVQPDWTRPEVRGSCAKHAPPGSLARGVLSVWGIHTVPFFHSRSVPAPVACLRSSSSLRSSWLQTVRGGAFPTESMSWGSWVYRSP